MEILIFVKDYWLVSIALAAAVIYKIYRVRFKGFIGEKSIAIRLNRLDSEKYHVINNLVLNVNSKTSQIDHLVISESGLFVIETKNYNGWILGREHAQYWTQVIYHRKEKFYNPIRQNRGHIAALRHYLQSFTNLIYIPIVVFNDRCTIKVDTESLVIYNSQLINIICSYTDNRLSPSERKAIFESIMTADVSRTYKRSAHIKSIKKGIANRDNLVRHGICPRCGGELVNRSAKFGGFIGCKNFPRCKFTYG